MKVLEYLKSVGEGYYNLIDEEGLSELLDKEEDIVLLDIRKQVDYDKLSIKGSIHCEWEDVGKLVESGDFDLSKDIIVCCYSGQSSMQVATLLSLMDYSAVSLLDGILAFDNEKYLVRSECESN